ncbi:hypothetical protein [Chamaesiphon sp. VAR_69_metabat_338]|uniref:hypothetical protein n=1 Tax=Chamaesiphon sp. VAR_69_metabat_338 TaxID=2964704 RepID=UPI00286DC170|nr:hypothetical protein [Chamaesiphon sp. VAR_69_metabat_338]
MQKIWQSAITTFLVTIASSLPAWSITAGNLSAPTVKPIADRPKVALHKTTCLRLTYSNGSIVHAGKLWLNDRGMGRITVKYFNPDLGRQESVDQTIRSENTPQGILLVGSNPIYSGTRRRIPTYSPDSFLLRIDENGRRSFFTFDLNRNTSSVEVSSC